MQFTLDGTTIISGVVCALWVVTIALSGAVFKRMQSDANQNREAIAQLNRDLALFREFVALKYPNRDEVKNERDETRNLFMQIDTKITNLQTFLMKAKIS